MNFRNFKLKIILRVAGITGFVFLFFYSLSLNYYIMPVIVGVVIIYQVFSLIHFLNRTNRELASFLESIRFSEFTRSFRMEGLGGSYSELSKAFNEVIKDFQKVRSEKEEHFHYLQTVVQNIDASLIAYQKDGTVELINKAAKKLFQVSALKNIQDLKSRSSELTGTLLKIKPGESKLVKIRDEEDILHLAIYSTTIKIKNKLIVLATIKDLQNVLEEQETEAWQKLIRVLTHEIMNSITPIASLSSTLDNMLKGIATDNKGENVRLEKKAVNEIHEALQTINKRSMGLLHFVNTYRNLTRIPKPNFKIYSVSKLFINIKKLMHDELAKSNIKLIVNIKPENININADEELIEQVIINLIQNSIYALRSTKKGVIQLHGFLNKRGRATIQVIDNGPGILKDVLDKIFIPFFTTKRSGSGIGLSLSRQIIRLHNGTITAHSEPNKETVFTLTF
jgi:two-component system nitrogen regulation sensor histidine kinase NtrY